jgi:hypothetical protein
MTDGIPEMARIIAAIRGVSMTDLISDMIRDPLSAMEQQVLDQRAAARRPAKPPKRKGGLE